MVVPKRAALLLDRLMVALHRALENELSGKAKLSKFYNTNKNDNTSNKNVKSGGTERFKEENKNHNNQESKDYSYLSMYSEDDPAVMMDYDFKDLNSINRATGETLMGQSFQRRANVGLEVGTDVGVEGVSSLVDTSAASGIRRGLLNGYNGGDGGTIIGMGGGRAASSYWRCYFNAVIA